MIPLSVPNISGNEWLYIKECLDTNWVSSVGGYVSGFEKKISDFTGSKFAVATSNGTSALHISLLLSGVRSGDLVILPNLTFVASANSIKYCGADPLFIDVDSDNWQMDLSLLENFLSNETIIRRNECFHKKSNRIIRAIMPVHVHGNMCDMNLLTELSEKYKLHVVEDATEALGSCFNRQHAGTFGAFGCFSFNGNKIITTGGGGMIVTDNEKSAKRAKHLTTQAKSDVFEYIHDEIGYNYRLVNLLAAMGTAQLEQLPLFLKKKKYIKEKYDSVFLKIENIKSQFVNADVQSNYWLYTISAPKHKALMNYMTENRVEVRPLWKPLNMLRIFSGHTYISYHDISNKLYDSCVSLPCSTGISDSEIEKVISLVSHFYS